MYKSIPRTISKIERILNACEAALEAGADVNTRTDDGDTILHAAIVEGIPNHIQMVERLIAKRADVNSFENAKKAKAEQDARVKAEQDARVKAEQDARVKAEQDARVKAEQETLAKAEQEARVKAEQDARVKAEKEKSATVVNYDAIKDLKLAIKFPYAHHALDAFEAALKAGADVNTLTDDGKTVLYAAIIGDAQNHHRMIEQLIAKDADVNVPNKNGLTPLAGAVLKQNKHVVKMLIKARANVNAVIDGETLLSFAQGCTTPEIEQLLIARGAQLKRELI
jgi:ankyrin repeat protein